MLNTLSAILQNPGGKQVSEANVQSGSRAENRTSKLAEPTGNTKVRQDFSDLNAAALDELNQEKLRVRKSLLKAAEFVNDAVAKRIGGGEPAEGGKLLPLSELLTKAEQGQLSEEFIKGLTELLSGLGDNPNEFQGNALNDLLVAGDPQNLNLENALPQDLANLISRLSAKEKDFLQSELGTDWVQQLEQLILAPRDGSPIQQMPVEFQELPYTEMPFQEGDNQELPWVQMPPEWQKGAVGSFELSQANIAGRTGAEKGLGVATQTTNGLSVASATASGQGEKISNDLLMANGALEKLGENASKIPTEQLANPKFSPGQLVADDNFAITPALNTNNRLLAAADRELSDLKLAGFSKSLLSSAVSMTQLSSRITSARNKEATGVTATSAVVPGSAAGATESTAGNPKLISTAQTQAPTILAEPLQIYSKNWQQNLGRQITWMQQMGVNSAEIQLDPAELGPITIKVSAQGNETQVSVQATHNQTRELLEQNQQRLKDLMEQSGMNLSQFDVSGESAREKSESGSEIADRKTDLDSSTINELSVEQIELSSTASGGLDLFV